jgi:hypothetical protein
MVVATNMINLFVVGVLLARASGKKRLEHVLGLAMVVLVLPLVFFIIRSAVGGREWWTIVLPSIMAAYLIVELILDYILKSEFRKTAMLWPYLVLFYASQMGMIGFAFLTGRIYGYVTLATYFLGLFAAWYSYSKVGHG